MSKEDLRDVKHIVHLSTKESQSCEECGEGIGFDGLVNHYLDKHDYQLLHIGTETDPDLKVGLRQYTVAILGAQ